MLLRYKYMRSMHNTDVTFVPKPEDFAETHVECWQGRKKQGQKQKKIGGGGEDDMENLSILPILQVLLVQKSRLQLR